MNFSELTDFIEEKAITGITNVPILKLSTTDVKVARVKLLPSLLEKPDKVAGFAVHYVPNRGYLICTEKTSNVDKEYISKPCEVCKVLRGADKNTEKTSKAKYRIVLPVFVMKTASVTGDKVDINEPMFFSQSINTDFVKELIALLKQHPEYVTLNNPVTLLISASYDNGFTRYSFQVSTDDKHAFNESLYDEKIKAFYQTYKAEDLYREATDEDLAALNPNFIAPKKKAPKNTTTATPATDTTVEDDNGLDDIDLDNI